MKSKSQSQTQNLNIYDMVKNMQMPVPAPKKEPLDILSIIIAIKNNPSLKTRESKVSYLRQYPHISTDYEKLYNLIINHNLNDNSVKDIKILNTMIEKIEDEKNKKINEMDRDKQIGTLLMKEFLLKPNQNPPNNA